MNNRMITSLTGTTQPAIVATAVAVALVVGPLPSAQAAIALDRTRVIFDGAQNSVTLNISNQNKELPYLAQGWIEDDRGNKITSPFTALPPLQRVEPGSQSQMKIQALPAVRLLKQDRETLFYFNLREVPPKSTKPNTLQIALQTHIKLFYRPAAIAPDPNGFPPQERLTLSHQGDNYVVNNPTPYYVTIVDAHTRKDAPGITGFQPLMVPPKGSLPLTVSAATVGSTPVLTYINDYGGQVPLSFRCSGGNCSVIPDKKV